MDEQRQDDQLEPTYNSSVLIQDVALKTYQKRWTIEKGGGRESGWSVLMAWHEDADEIYNPCYFVYWYQWLLRQVSSCHRYQYDTSKHF